MINVIKQQESSPFTTVRKSFEKSYLYFAWLLHLPVHLMKAVCKNFSLF